MRIVHLSDIHLWRYSWNPFALMNKRAVGMASLIAGRARKFRLERLEAVVDRVVALDADHVLITGDLTTTALPSEFDDAARGLERLLTDPSRATIIPGNHDRYTPRSVRTGAFESHFERFLPSPRFPWIKPLDERTGVLGLDATRSHLTATGRLGPHQLEAARGLPRPSRLIVANHYPALAPPSHRGELARKRLIDAEDLQTWLRGVGPHLYCCGHVHAAWAHRPADWPDHVSLNAGAPLLRDRTGLRPPGFLEIELHDATVSALHHFWNGSEWDERPLLQIPDFFPAAGGQDGCEAL